MKSLIDLPLAAYRIVVTQALVDSVESAFPAFVTRFMEASTGFLGHYCEGAADKPFDSLDFDWLARYTFELFYLVLSAPEIEDTAEVSDLALSCLQNLHSSLAINYFIHRNEQFLGTRNKLMLTLVLDVLPAAITDTDSHQSFTLLRSSHELHINQLH